MVSEYMRKRLCWIRAVHELVEVNFGAVALLEAVGPDVGARVTGLVPDDYSVATSVDGDLRKVRAARQVFDELCRTPAVELRVTVRPEVEVRACIPSAVSCRPRGSPCSTGTTDSLRCLRVGTTRPRSAAGLSPSAKCLLTQSPFCIRVQLTEYTEPTSSCGPSVPAPDPGHAGRIVQLHELLLRSGLQLLHDLLP
jgi:hypothetical protein